MRDPVETRSPIRQKGKVIDWQMVTTDTGVADKRLLVAETEFGGALRALEREGNKLSSIIRLAWDSGNLKTFRPRSPHKASDPHIKMRRPHHDRRTSVAFVAGGHRERIREPFPMARRATTAAATIWWGTARYAMGYKRAGVGDEGVPEPSAGSHGATAPVNSGRLCMTNWPNYHLDHWLRSSAVDNHTCSGWLGFTHWPMDWLASRSATCWPLKLCGTHRPSVPATFSGTAWGDPNAEKIMSALMEAVPEGLTRTEISIRVFKRNLASVKIKALIATLIESGGSCEVKEVTSGAPLHHISQRRMN